MIYWGSVCIFYGVCEVTGKIGSVSSAEVLNKYYYKVFLKNYYQTSESYNQTYNQTSESYNQTSDVI